MGEVGKWGEVVEKLVWSCENESEDEDIEIEWGLASMDLAFDFRILHILCALLQLLLQLHTRNVFLPSSYLIY